MTDSTRDHPSPNSSTLKFSEYIASESKTLFPDHNNFRVAMNLKHLVIASDLFVFYPTSKTSFELLPFTKTEPLSINFPSTPLDIFLVSPVTNFKYYIAVLTSITNIEIIKFDNLNNSLKKVKSKEIQENFFPKLLDFPFGVKLISQRTFLTLSVSKYTLKMRCRRLSEFSLGNYQIENTFCSLNNNQFVENKNANEKDLHKINIDYFLLREKSKSNFKVLKLPENGKIDKIEILKFNLNFSRILESYEIENFGVFKEESESFIVVLKRLNSKSSEDSIKILIFEVEKNSDSDKSLSQIEEFEILSDGFKQVKILDDKIIIENKFSFMVLKKNGKSFFNSEFKFDKNNNERKNKDKSLVKILEDDSAIFVSELGFEKIKFEELKIENGLKEKEVKKITEIEKKETKPKDGEKKNRISKREMIENLQEKIKSMKKSLKTLTMENLKLKEKLENVDQILRK